MVEQKIYLRRGTKAVLEAKLVGANKPGNGEPIYEIPSVSNGTTTGALLKIGDGIHDYADLPYVGANPAAGQLSFSNRYEFPAVGTENVLYIAKDEKNSYIWTGTYYELVSVDHSKIDGGNANSF